MGEKKPAVSVYPYWHTILFIATTSAFCIQNLPTLESLDDIANADTFTTVVFPEYLTALHVGTLRLAFGSLMLGDSLYQFWYGVWDQITEYAPESVLHPVKIPFRGFHSSGSVFRGSLNLSYFTFWAWVLEGFVFILLGAIPILIHTFNTSLSPWILRTALVGWEIAAPASMLVTTVVKFVLWPMAQKLEDKTNLGLLNNTMSLIEHNFNFIACILEVTLLGGLPIRYTDLPFTNLFGILYVLFSYAVKDLWVDRCHGSQFLYPFFDPSLGWWHTASLLGLLLFLSLFHVVFCWLDHVLTETLGGSLLYHGTAVVTLTLLVCKFRD